MIELVGLQELFRHLQILRAGIIKKSLLGIQLGQTQHAFHGSFELAQLLVHGNGFDGEPLRGIGVAYTLEAVRGLFNIAES